MGYQNGAMAPILITGAAGRIGSYLRAGLPTLGWSLRLLDAAAIDDAEGAVRADIRDGAAVESAMAGVDAVVHLAGIPNEAGFPELLAMNIDGTYQVFDAARRAQVRRVVFASSNHVVGFAPRGDRLDAAAPVRPDSYYGVSKVFGEALGRLYVDRHGMKAACLRIGSCLDRPTTPRHLSTWLSPDDAVRLVHACLVSPTLTYAVVYGISANTRGWWDMGPGRRLGYEPEDDAEVFAEEILAAHGPVDRADPDQARVGGLLASRHAHPR